MLIICSVTRVIRVIQVIVVLRNMFPPVLNPYDAFVDDKVEGCGIDFRIERAYLIDVIVDGFRGW
jgi:hypothetical protein